MGGYRRLILTIHLLDKKVHGLAFVCLQNKRFSARVFKGGTMTIKLYIFVEIDFDGTLQGLGNNVNVSKDPGAFPITVEMPSYASCFFSVQRGSARTPFQAQITHDTMVPEIGGSVADCIV